MSILDIDNPEKKNCYIFSSDTKNTIGSFLINRITPEDQEGKLKFSKGIFLDILQEYGWNGKDKIIFYGFGISTDIDMLKKYDLIYTYDSSDKYILESSYLGRSNYEIEVEYFDLQNTMRLLVGSGYRRIYEKDMIINGCGLEVCYQLVTDKEFIGTHVCTDEVEAIYEIYNIVSKQDKSYYLSYVPFGYMKGQTIQDAVRYNRSSVNGYRFNNKDLLSLSYSNHIYNDSDFDDYYDYDY